MKLLSRDVGLVSRILAGLPPAVLVVLVFLWGVDVPFWDQWLLVPLIEKWKQGSLALADLWHQHGDHRIFFPRLVMLAMVLVSDWNIRWGLAVDVVFAGGSFLIITALIRKSFDSEKSLLPRWLVPPVVSLFVFNLNQWENWTSGLHTILLSTSAVLGGLGLVAHGAHRTRNLVAAACLGCVASYSFANGLLFWPLSLPLVLVPSRGRRVRGAVWTVLGIAVIGSYFYGFSAVDGSAIPRSIEECVRLAAYAVVVLGAAIFSYDGKLAAGAGLIGCLTLVILLVRLARTDRPALRPVLLWGIIAGYGVGSAVLVAAGRSQLEFGLAMSSRYITMSNLFWLGLLGLAVAWPAEVAWRDRIPIKTAAAAAVILLLASSLWGGVLFRRQYLDRTVAKNALLAGELGPGHPLLLPDNRIPAESVDTLRRYRLSLFREDPRQDP
ncbi:MAG: hypothetical protein GY856_03565 [bacterium]|nr:hypothetical protein [bacterium]